MKYSEHMDKKVYHAAKITGPLVNLAYRTVNPFIVPVPRVCLVLDIKWRQIIPTVYTLWIREYLSPVYTILYKNTVYRLAKIRIEEINDNRQYFPNPLNMKDRYLMANQYSKENTDGGLLNCENVEFIE